MVGWVLIETLMWTVIVEVTLVGAQHSTGVTIVVDQHPVGALGSDTADEPLRIAVRARRAPWRLDDLNTLSGEHGIERSGELRVPVADQKPKPADSVTEVHDQVAGLLGGLLGRRVGRDPEDVHLPSGDLHHDQHVQPTQIDGVDMEEVRRE